MVKQIAAIALAALVGSAVTYHFMPATPSARFTAPVTPELRNVPEISSEKALLHREQRYESILTIADILALPTDFAETEALYVVAGRSDSGEVQALIHQAAGIADPEDRRAALGILFLRLTELDPRSALAIARAPAFRGQKSLQNEVWIAWGRLDLDAAVSEAAMGDAAQRQLAAQALYRSARGIDNAKSRLIEAELKIPPGKSARTQHLYALADESPANAIKYIESLASIAEQREQMGWLAYRLSQSDVAIDVNYTELIRSPYNRKIFQQALLAQNSISDPESALRRILEGPMNTQSRSLAYSALSQLARQDPEKAFAYAEQFPDRSSQKNVGAIIANAMAQRDPEKALAWARENDPSGDQMLLAGIVSQIAMTDPERAISEAQAMTNPRARSQALSGIVMSAAEHDPAQAAQILDMITDSSSRHMGITQLASSWVLADFDAAVDWASSLDPAEQKMALQNMGRNLIHADLDRAIELQQMLPIEAARAMRVQIAEQLARDRSVQAAQSFIAQFDNTPEYSKLQSTVISSAARRDPSAAMQLARAVENPADRDRLYVTIVGQHADLAPREALQWLDSIAGDQARRKATAQIARAWYSQDPVEAERWLSGLSRGAERDDAIVATIAIRAHVGDDINSLIDSIDDSKKRKQAILARLQILSRSNPVKAKQLLTEADLTDAERARYRQVLEQNSY